MKATYGIQITQTQSGGWRASIIMPDGTTLTDDQHIYDSDSAAVIAGADMLKRHVDDWHLKRYGQRIGKVESEAL